MADARLVQLCDTYILNLDVFVSAVFYMSDRDGPARIVIETTDSKWTFEGPKVIEVWSRLRDLCEGQGERHG